MKRLHAAFAIVCTLLVAACLPVTTKTPVGSTVGLGADSALYGTWKARSADPDDKQKDFGYFHFITGKDGTMTALMVIAAGGSDDEWTAFALRTATLGKNHFMNVVETFDNNEPVASDLKDTSFPVLYKFGKNHTLTLYLLDEDKTKEAIAAGKLQGVIESGSYGDVKITSDDAALDAFMATPEAVKLFKMFLVLKKTE